MNKLDRVISTPEQLRALTAYMDRFRLERPIRIVVSHYIRPRSTEQNARLWLLHARAAEVTGHTVDEMHEFALMRHFGTHETKVGDMIISTPMRRSSDLDKQEFTGLMEATEAWYADEFGAVLEQMA